MPRRLRLWRYEQREGRTGDKVTTILALVIGGLLFWTLQRKQFKPYRWAWAFGIAQAVCGLAGWLLDLNLSRLWLALCVAWAVFACLGYLTEYIDKAVISSQLG